MAPEPPVADPWHRLFSHRAGLWCADLCWTAGLWWAVLGLWWAVLGSVMLYSTLTYKCSSIVREHKTAVRGHGGYFQVQAGTAQTRAWYSLLKPIRAVVSNSFWAGGRIGRNMTS